jgi:hypothetical protein
LETPPKVSKILRLEYLEQGETGWDAIIRDDDVEFGLAQMRRWNWMVQQEVVPTEALFTSDAMRILY